MDSLKTFRERLLKKEKKRRNDIESFNELLKCYYRPEMLDSLSMRRGIYRQELARSEKHSAKTRKLLLQKGLYSYRKAKVRPLP